MPLSRNAYLLLGLTAVVARARRAPGRSRCCASWRRRGTPGAAPRTAASRRCSRRRCEEAVSKLKAQERATAARAEASERLSGEIVTSLTAGLLVVGLNAEIRILNPAGRRMLGVTENPGLEDYRRVLAEPLAQMIDECLATRVPILRRTVRLTDRRCDASGRDRLAAVRPPRRAARRHLPVFRSDGRQGSRGAAAAERKPGDGGRADRRHRARVPERAGDDSRLRQADRSRCAARRVQTVRGRHSRRDRIALRRWSPTS